MKSSMTVKKAVGMFKSNGSLGIYEPCDCGSQVRHHNGGNYHMIIEFQRHNDGRVLIREDDTCELTPREGWSVSSWEEMESIVSSHLDWEIE